MTPKPHQRLLKAQAILMLIAAAAVVISCLPAGVTQFAPHWYLAMMLVAAQAAADLLPFTVMRSGSRGEFTASGMVIVAAVLLLPAQLGILTIALGTAAQLVTGREGFRLGMHNLAAMIVSVFPVFYAARLIGSLGVNPQGIVGAIVGASLGEICSLSLVSLTLTLGGRVRFWSFFRNGLVASAIPWPWLVSMGVLLGAVGSAIPWSLPLTIAPLTLILLASRSRVEATEERARLDGLLTATTAILHANSVISVTKAAASGAATLFEGQDGRIDTEPERPGELGAELSTERFGVQYLVVGERGAIAHRYTDRDLRLLETLASVAASALDKAALHEDVAEQATTDALTGLANRRSFEEQVRVTLSGMRASDGSGIVFVDLDRFKQINDEHGHQAGDEVLVEVSKRLSAAVRGGDIVARLGGDEFTILLRGVHGADDAVMVANRVLASMHDPIHLSNDVDVSTTPSIGIALALQPGLDPVAVLKDADAAMYEAKRAGKDCWRLAGETTALVG